MKKEKDIYYIYTYILYIQKERKNQFNYIINLLIFYDYGKESENISGW